MCLCILDVLWLLLNALMQHLKQHQSVLFPVLHPCLQQQSQDIWDVYLILYIDPNQP